MDGKKSYKDVAVIILAAGKGTRMKSDLPKVLHKVAGKSMVVRVVECAQKISPDHIHVVVGHMAELVKDELNKYVSVNFSIQKELLGTGDAVKAALPQIGPEVKDILVLCGDVPLIKEKSLSDFIWSHQNREAVVSVLAVELENPFGYGRIISDEKGDILCIKEESDADDEEKKITTVNSGIYIFNRNFLVSAIDEIKPENSQAEYYLTDLVEIAKNRDVKMIFSKIEDKNQVIGVNTIMDLKNAEQQINNK